jgi:hypothetical protein
MRPSYDRQATVATAPPVLLRPVGFWSARDGDGLPDPRLIMSTTWEKNRRDYIAAYLMKGGVLDEVPPQHCIICGVKCGSRERTDGVWRWPESLAHYVITHGVKLPAELVEHMAKSGFEPPRVDVRSLRESLPPTNPAATSLISQGSVAAVLDDMLSDNHAASPSPKKKSAAASATAVKMSNNAALEDETAAIPTATVWTAMVQGVPTQPQKIVFDRPVVLGRDRTCDVVLQHQSVSRRHARLVPSKDRVIVQDLGSSNGVWVKNRKWEGQVELEDGEQFAVGQATITVVRER